MGSSATYGLRTCWTTGARWDRTTMRQTRCARPPPTRRSRCRTKYKNACEASRFLFTPLVLEMYGGLGTALTSFMKKMVDVVALRSDDAARRRRRRVDPEARMVADGAEAYPSSTAKAQEHVQWERRISVALARTVGQRLLGGGVDAVVGIAVVSESGTAHGTRVGVHDYTCTRRIK